METDKYWFDERGHLVPYEIIEFSLEEFKQVFVSQMEDKAHREALFQNYLRFLAELQSKVKGSFFQLLDGSFTTTKSKPEDLDLVNFMDVRVFDRSNRSGIIWLLENAKEVYKVDCFFVLECKPFHPMYAKYLSDTEYWNKLFGNSREDENLVQHPKGIVKINFRHEYQSI